MGQADIEEGILDHRLHHGKREDHTAGTSLRQQKTAAQKTADQDGQDSGKGKAYPGEEDLTQRIIPGYVKVLIT